MLNPNDRSQIERVLGRALTDVELVEVDGIDKLSDPARRVAIKLADKQLILADLYLRQVANANVGDASKFQQRFVVVFKEQPIPDGFPREQGTLLLYPTRPPYRIGANVVAWKTNVAHWNHAFERDEFEKMAAAMSKDSREFQVPTEDEVRDATKDGRWTTIRDSFMTWPSSNERVPLLQYLVGEDTVLDAAWLGAVLVFSKAGRRVELNLSEVRPTATGVALLWWKSESIGVRFAHRSLDGELLFAEHDVGTEETQQHSDSSGRAFDKPRVQQDAARSRISIEDAARHLLRNLGSYEKFPDDPNRGRYSFDGDELVEITGLNANQLNDAAAILEHSGYVELHSFLGTDPFDFGSIKLTTHGRLELERVERAQRSSSHEVPEANPRYEPVARVGEGAFGEVWRGVDTHLRRSIAIKFTRQSGSLNEALAHARALTRVVHPNIVTIFDVAHVLDPVTNASVPAIIMELVEGETLDQRLKTAVRRNDVVSIGQALVAAVGAYHDNDLAHMDLHGNNIIVGSTLVKVIDATCTESGYIGSTATREGQRRRDVVWLRDHLRNLLVAGAASMDDVFRFERETTSLTLEEVRRVFTEILAADPAERAQARLEEFSAGPHQRQQLERAIGAATSSAVVIFGGITASFPSQRNAPIHGEIQLGMRDDLCFQIRVPIKGIHGIPLLNIPYGKLVDSWVDAAGRLTVDLVANVFWNGTELMLVPER